MNHLEVVSILKELPARVCLVCARAPLPPAAVGGALVKAKSDGSLAGAGAAGAGGGAGAGSSGAEGSAGGALAGARLRSRSLEPLTGLAMWSSEPQVIGINLLHLTFLISGCAG